MDPLSFAASVLAVITAAQPAIQGLRKLDAFRKAPRELEDLTLELESMESLLKDIEHLVDLYPTLSYSGNLSSSVLSAASMINEINKLLVSVRLKRLNLSDAAQARLSFVRYKDRLRALRDDLRAVKMDMVVRLGLVTA